MSKSDKRRGGFRKWFGNRKFRTKIVMLISVIIFSFLLSIGIATFSIILQNVATNIFIDQNSEIQSTAKEIQGIGESLVVDVFNYAATFGSNESKTHYFDTKDIFSQVREKLISLSVTIKEVQNLDLSVYVSEILNDIELIFDISETKEEIAASGTLKLGLFDRIDIEVQQIDDLEVQLTQLQNNITEFHDSVKGHQNETLLLEKAWDLQYNLALGERGLLHYLIQASEKDLLEVQWILGIETNPDKVNNSNITQYQPLGTLVNESRIFVGTNQTLVAMLDQLDLNTNLGTNQTIDLLETNLRIRNSIDRLSVANNELNRDAQNLITFLDADLAEKREQLTSLTRNTLLFEVLSTVVALVISISIGIIVTSQTVRPLKDLESEAIKVANGDLSGETSFDYFSNDEIGKLTSHFNTMLSSLKSLVSTVVQSSNKVSSSSEDLAAMSEETNASTEELAATAQSMSESANQQVEVINVTLAEIKKMANLLNEVIGQIEKNSNTISQIALQTNILALNAGIEASRAGDYGRGFAVVARNVRTLSEESQQAVESINKVTFSISESLESSFNTIRSHIEQVSELAEDTAASSEEIAASAEEVTSTMEQVAASSHALFNLAYKALEDVSRFKLK